MKLPKRFHRQLGAVLLVSTLLLSGSSATPTPSLQTWGEVVSGLQMAIYLDQAKTIPSKLPKFRVELRNAGENDLVLNLGIMLANGKRQYPSAVFLTLTDAQAKSRRLDLLGPAGIAGRSDPFVLPIPVGAAFSIPVDLSKYAAVASKEFDYKPQPGAYSIEAQFTGSGVTQQEANLDVKGIALMPYWKGTVTSNQLRFEIPNQ
jgi:hypothetical protein